MDNLPQPGVTQADDSRQLDTTRIMDKIMSLDNFPEYRTQLAKLMHLYNYPKHKVTQKNPIIICENKYSLTFNK